MKPLHSLALIIALLVGRGIYLSVGLGFVSEQFGKNMARTA